MNYYLLSVESTISRKKIKISIFLIVVITVIIATLLGIQFAKYISDKNFIISLNNNKENAQILEEKIKEEKQIAELERQNNVPRVPVYTEKSIENYNNIYISDEKIAYLTFDDGPSRAVTPLILDKLKENDVKATFFVLGSRVRINPSLVKRTYDEGHYIANHSYSHVYKDIYVSKEALMDEYNRTEIAIREALGISEYNSHLFRFPGGSMGNNKYTKVKNEAKQLLQESGVFYLDWNSLTGDSEGKYTKEALLEHLHWTSEDKGNVLVVLMHDAPDKILTAETLQDVIDLLRNKGYEFRSFYNIME